MAPVLMPTFFDCGRWTTDDCRSKMAYKSARNSKFLSTAARWIAATQDVLALIRFHAAAGSKSFEFFDSFDAFQGRLAKLPPRACVTIFRELQLPLRGRVDAAFIKQATTDIPCGTEYLVVNLDPTTIGTATWYDHCAGETHEELQEDLEDRAGCLVAVGPYPPWLEDDEDVASAIVPDHDGSIQTGDY